MINESLLYFDLSAVQYGSARIADVSASLLYHSYLFTRVTETDLIYLLNQLKRREAPHVRKKVNIKASDDVCASVSVHVAGCE